MGSRPGANALPASYTITGLRSVAERFVVWDGGDKEIG